MSVDNLMQVVAKDSAIGKTISWQYDSDRSDYSVEYRHKDQGDVQLAYVTEGNGLPFTTPTIRHPIRMGLTCRN